MRLSFYSTVKWDSEYHSRVGGFQNRKFYESQRNLYSIVLDLDLLEVIYLANKIQ